MASDARRKPGAGDAQRSRATGVGRSGDHFVGQGNVPTGPAQDLRLSADMGAAAQGNVVENREENRPAHHARARSFAAAASVQDVVPSPCRQDGGGGAEPGLADRYDQLPAVGFFGAVPGGGDRLFHAEDRGLESGPAVPCRGVDRRGAHGAGATGRHTGNRAAAAVGQRQPAVFETICRAPVVDENSRGIHGVQCAR